MLIYARFFLLLLMTCGSLAVNAQLWVSENNWTDQWESQYSQWISKEVDKSFFLKANFETDCADAVIALRIIFARQNKLPFQFTTGSGDKINNLSKIFKAADLSQDWFVDRNFILALKEILSRTNSKTLIQDSVSIRITQNELYAGTYFIHDFNNSGHVDLVHKVILNGQIYPIRMLSSTVPKKTRELLEYPFYFSSKPIKNKTGFFKFRNPIEKNGLVSYLGIDNNANYEQYQLGENDLIFSDYVSLQLLKMPLSSYAKAFDLMQLLISKINERVRIIQNGFAFCIINSCADGSQGYYNYSTPSRDANILYIIMQLKSAMSQSQNSQDEISAISDLLYEFYDIRFEISYNTQVSGKQILEIWSNGLYSSNPRDTVLTRWGLK